MLYRFDGKIPEIGKDTYVSDLASVIGDVTIGDNCYIGHGAILRGDYGMISVGSGTAIEEGVIVHAPPDDFCSIGSRVTIGHGAIIHCKSIGDNAVIGMGAVLSIRSVIGAGAIVAEGAIVTMRQEITQKVMVAGNPARFIRDVTVEDEKMWARAKQIYVDLALKYLKVGMQKA
ncbi:Transferase hexapeptide repeat containing protein [uncultured Desulfobacterium sp.]|uniref:Transferase hexapeptide repeat containing protein n=1 Tax=uncultured Desulfobacterium sp. TaxID=201089 RepID=A0A445MR72_9BACT|nr:Transferase hexapeptide repeat containing protein [uncultured Desulfobacterium sp.]